MLKVIYQPDAEAELLEAVPFYGSREEAAEDPVSYTHLDVYKRQDSVRWSEP